MSHYIHYFTTVAEEDGLCACACACACAFVSYLLRVYIRFNAFNNIS